MRDRTGETIWHRRQVWLGSGLLVCLLLAWTAGAAAGARSTPPSVVKVTGATHVSFQVTNPKDPNRCALLRDTGGLVRVGLQNIRGRNDLLDTFVGDGRPGKTIHLPASGLPPYAEFDIGAGTKRWVTGTYTNSNTNVAYHVGSGTMKMSANGRSGSFLGTLVPDPIYAGKTSGQVHIAAHWDCTSKFGSVTRGY
jgi:hypothetical protein